MTRRVAHDCPWCRCHEPCVVNVYAPGYRLVVEVDRITWAANEARIAAQRERDAS